MNWSIIFFFLPTIVVVLTFGLLTHRAQRKRALKHINDDIVFHVVNLIIEIKKLGLMDKGEKLPSAAEMHALANEDSGNYKLSEAFKGMKEGLLTSKRINQYEELKEPFQQLSFAACKMALWKKPGHFFLILPIASAITIIHFGIQAFSDKHQKEKQAEIFGAALLRKVIGPVFA